MSEESRSNEEYDPLKEIKKLEMQEQLVANAFNNSYRILNNEITFDEMLDDFAISVTGLACCWIH